ncbi:MAG: class II glutamine amidotransferase [Planctomycetaceae bacterium]
MAELHHECGIAAVYHLPNAETSRFAPRGDAQQSSRLIPRILLDIQNRGQLAAGMTTYSTERNQLIDTHKDVGSVSEVFHLNHPQKSEDLMSEYAGHAAIGHVRYATCGKDDRSYAQPFERHHIERSKWFSFAFNGQLSNYLDLRKEILSETDFHLARETDTEILMHMICQELTTDPRMAPADILKNLARRLDGAYNIVYLNARGDMFVSRDPLGIRPLCYVVDGPEERPRMVVAASESVALANLGFTEKNIKSLEPGTALIIRDGKFSIERYAESPRKAHCFFEWIYFANAASTLDDRSVYLSRKRLGEELARQEQLDLDKDTIVVPVPDTAKGAAARHGLRIEYSLPGRLAAKPLCRSNLHRQ